MQSWLKGCLLVWLSLTITSAWAMGLGGLHVKNPLGAPFDAELDLLAGLNASAEHWVVEILPDPLHPSGIAAEDLQGLTGEVVGAGDGRLVVRLRSQAPIPAAEFGFRLRVASGTEALIGRLTATQAPLPLPQARVTRALPQRPRAAPPVAAPAPLAVPGAPPAPVEASAPPTSTLATAAPSTLPDATPMVQEKPAVPAASLNETPAAPVASAPAPTVETTPAAATPVVPPAPVVAPEPPQTAAVERVDTLENLAAAGEAIDLGQALTIAGGLAVLVVLLVMRRRLAALVVGRFSHAQDAALKSEITRKLEAKAEEAAVRVESTPTSAAAPEKPRTEADLNAEIDVLLAYAQYQKAEERLQSVLAESPHNVPARLRLAELRYITEDTEGFVAMVEDIQANYRREVSDEQWQKLMRMGKILAPDAALFSGPRPVQRDVS